MADPFADQRALASGFAAVRVSAGVATVRGADRVAVLNNVVTQKIVAAAGSSFDALELDGNGRILKVVHGIVTEDSLVLIVSGLTGAEVAAWVDSRVFLEDVVATDSDSEFVVLGAVQTLSDTAWIDPWPEQQAGGFVYEMEQAGTWAYAESLWPSTVQPPLPIVEESAFDALRIAAGRPALPEVDDRALPHELGWLRTAVHLSKGCFPGQETIAKIHNVGHPPRRLVRLHLDGSDSVFAERGDVVTLEDREVGVITTAANHHEDGPIALALIKRTVDVSSVLSVTRDGHPISATQEVVVSPTTGATAAERLRPNRQ
jgi:folate-binding protein YgfZ